MAVSYKGALCALLILAILLAQVSATSSPLQSTPPKKWIDYIWSTPITTSIENLAFTTGLPEGRGKFLSLEGYSKKTSTKIVPVVSTPISNSEKDVKSHWSTLTSWLPLPAPNVPFNLTFFDRQDDVAEKHVNMSSNEVKSRSKPTRQSQRKGDEKYTFWGNSYRGWDCSLLKKTLNTEFDRCAYRWGCPNPNSYAWTFEKYKRRGCTGFYRRAASVLGLTLSELMEFYQVHRNLSSTSEAAAAAGETSLQIFNRLATASPRIYGDVICVLVVSAILMHFILFFMSLLCLYHVDRSFQPVEAMDLVMKIYGIEHFQIEAVHLYKNLCRKVWRIYAVVNIMGPRGKILGYYAAVKALVSQGKVTKQMAGDFTVAPVDMASVPGKKPLLLVSLKNEPANDEDDAASLNLRGVTLGNPWSWLKNPKKDAKKNPVHGEDVEWLIVNRNEAEESDKEASR